jgi:polyisoprenyl-teichoic acid--peptidoglycan teichoic acid transferase
MFTCYNHHKNRLCDNAFAHCPEGIHCMDCTEARWLLDRGVEPGSRHPTRARLGFHLSSCAACRTYRTTIHQQLLTALLFEHPAGAAGPAIHAPAAKRRRRGRLGRAASILTAVMVLALVLIGMRVGAAALTIHENVQAYIVPTPSVASSIQPAAATDVPLAQIPTLRPTSSVLDEQPADQPMDPQVRPGRTASPQAQTIIPIVPTAVGAVPAGIIPTLSIITATPNIPPAGSDPITVLLLGSDQRPGESGPSRTDTVIVARIDPGLRRIALLSLPRDLIVEIPGYGYGRINAAHVYGDIDPSLGGGLALARTTVSSLISAPIDYAVLVDFEGFIGLIDAIGGVDINVPTALYDSAYPTMDYGYMEVYFEPGDQHMDGQRALQYARTRHMDSDFQRARRQQEIMLAAARRIQGQNPLELIDSIAAATTALRGYVYTDLPEERMVALAWALRNVSPDTIERYLVDETIIQFNGEGGGCSSADDYYAECVDPGALQSLVERWMGRSR